MSDVSSTSAEHSVSETRPRLGSLATRLDAALARCDSGPAIAELLDWLTAPVGLNLSVGRPEVLDRPAGLARAGVIARFAWPRLGTRVGLGVEVPLAHALVDALLGFERRPGEERLQVTPVAWGILAFALARTLARLAARPGPLGDWDLLLDRVGPEPFHVAGLGPVLTIRWPIRVAELEGSARLWLPSGLAAQWLQARPLDPPELSPADLAGRLGELSGEWHAEAGTITLRTGGLSRLREGLVLVPDGAPLRGEILAPVGPVALTLRVPDGRVVLPAEFEPQSAGARLIVRPPFLREYLPQATESPSMSPRPEPSERAPLGAIPATLVVELGRVNLPMSRLADLKAGDVVELSREPSEPIELTCNGRLVARGELVQIEDELGVRITSIYL